MVSDMEEKLNHKEINDKLEEFIVKEYVILTILPSPIRLGSPISKEK